MVRQNKSHTHFSLFLGVNYGGGAHHLALPHPLFVQGEGMVNTVWAQTTFEHTPQLTKFSTVSPIVQNCTIF